MNKGFDRPTWDEYFMLQAELAKLRSNCIARHVGAVIVRDHRQIATGYNGTPPGVKNCYEGGCKRCQLRVEGKIASGEALDRCICNHAEANAIMHCAILGIGSGTKDTTLYTTFVTCLECSKMAITTGIKRIVCLGSYPETDYQLLHDAGVEVVVLDGERMRYWLAVLLEETGSGLIPG
ncbi:MAG: dCMP deaminase family protein [Thaumarchaeota archaeon]|nr:dCMP deaminase family protein [Nitrososphaerota archaeon]